VDPPNAAILGTAGRLTHCFPETAIRIPDGTAMDLSSDSPPCVGVKLAQQLHKLSADTPVFGVVENEVSKAVDKMTEILGVHWEESQSCQKEPTSNKSYVCFY